MRKIRDQGAGTGTGRATSRTMSPAEPTGCAATIRRCKAFRNIEFYNAWNDHILYYGKRTAGRADVPADCAQP